MKKSLTEKELKAEIKKAEERLKYLSEFLQCDDCKKYVHESHLGQNEAWSTLCKKCVVN